MRSADFLFFKMGDIVEGLFVAGAVFSRVADEG